MNRRMTLVSIIPFAAVVRVVFCLIVYPRISESASLLGHDRYDTIARHLLEGSGYTIDPSGPPTTQRLPLYPILLYLAYAAMRTHTYTWVVQLIQVCLAAVTAWLIVLIGTRVPFIMILASFGLLKALDRRTGQAADRAPILDVAT